MHSPATAPIPSQGRIFSTFGNVQNNSVTSQLGGLEYSQAGLKSVVFRVFPAVFARLFATQQQRRNGRRLVHRVRNKGFEILEKTRFFFWCTCQFWGNFACYYHLNFKISLVKNFFRSFSGFSSGHSRDIQAVSCEMWSEMWRWAALLVDGLRDFCVKQSSAAKWPPSARQSNTKTEATCPVS